MKKKYFLTKGRNTPVFLNLAPLPIEFPLLPFRFIVNYKSTDIYRKAIVWSKTVYAETSLR